MANHHGLMQGPENMSVFVTPSEKAFWETSLHTNLRQCVNVGTVCPDLSINLFFQEAVVQELFL